MDLNELLFILLPLAVMAVVLIIVVLYLAAKNDNVRHKEVEKMKELMRTGAVDNENFYMELQSMVHDKIINKDFYGQLKKLLEDSFNEAEKTVSIPEPA